MNDSKLLWHGIFWINIPNLQIYTDEIGKLKITTSNKYSFQFLIVNKNGASQMCQKP
jgi:hypothetical protein